MTEQTVELTDAEKELNVLDANKKMLCKIAPQIFKRDGSVKKCPRSMTIKSDFQTMLKTYNSVKNGVLQAIKFDTEVFIQFCAKNVTVKITGAMAATIVLHESDILADVIGNGWVVC